MGRIAWRISITGALTLALAVSASCTKANPDYIPAGRADAKVLADGASARDLGGGEGGSPPDGGQVDQAIVAPPGFGKICTTQTAQSRCRAGQICVAFPQAVTGICLDQCSTAPCSAPSPAFATTCDQYYDRVTNRRYAVCYILCRRGGEKFPCPNTTDYRCGQLRNQEYACYAE